MVRGIIPALSIDLGHLVFAEEEEGEAMCDVQCTKTNVNGCDSLVSIISTSKAQKRFSVQHCTEEDWKVWSVIIFEKLTSSLNVHVDQ